MKKLSKTLLQTSRLSAFGIFCLARISQTPMSIVGIASIITVHDCIGERVRCAFGAADVGLSRVSGGPGLGMPRLERVAATRQTAAARVR